MGKTVSTWLKNGRLYDVTAGRFQDGDIEIQGERITSVGGRAPKDAGAIDLEGAWLLPGFIDCHVHLCVKTETADVSGLWNNSLPGEVAIYAARAARRT
ncbi:MAG: hypothetical protein ACREFM_16065, partial [Hypericibacter sp.]